MSAQAWLLLGTIITAAGTLLGTWLLIRQQGRQTRTTDAQQIIDQLQEIGAAAEEKHQREIKALDGRHQQEIAALRTEMGHLRRRVVRLEDRELASFDYIYALRAHIDQRKDPPPPPWPAALMHRIARTTSPSSQED